MEYGDAWDLQLRLVEARYQKRIAGDVIMLLEHFPVFTLGRRGRKDHLRVDENFLRSKGIQLVHVERGGDVTYHGPGQLVIYPIIALKAKRWGVVDFVTTLEELMIRIAADWGIKAERDQANRGVWVAKRKLGSVGIAVRRGIGFHGLAINVNTDLGPFRWINPCGLEGIQMTSLQKESGRVVQMPEVRDAAQSHLQRLLNVQLEIVTCSEIYACLGREAPKTTGRAI